MRKKGLLDFEGAQQSPRDQFAGRDVGRAEKSLRLGAEHGHVSRIGPVAAPAQARQETCRICQLTSCHIPHQIVYLIVVINNRSRLMS